jgi:hypothetical protein
MSERVATRHKAFSLARVRALASNTLLELVRLKVFYFVLIFALLMIGGSFFTADLSFQEQFQALKSMSLGAMSIFSSLLAMLATAMLLPKDLEDRTLYTILAKPVPRFEYLLGKLLGVLALLAIAIALMTTVFVIVLYARQQAALAHTAQSTPPEFVESALNAVRASTFNINLVPGIFAIYLKASVMASVTLLISTFATSSIFTVMMASAVYFIGQVQHIAREQWLESGGGLLAKLFLMVVAIAFPDMRIFDLIDDVIVGTAVPMGLFLQTTGLSMIYVGFYLLVGYLLFAWKEL